MDRVIAGVYQIKCTLNECVYIGSSVNIERRLRQHFEDLAKKSHANYKLQTAYCRLGKEVFETSILEVYTGKLRLPLYDLEQKWIDSAPNKYNLLKDAKAHLDKTAALLPEPTPKKQKKRKNKNKAKQSPVNNKGIFNCFKKSKHRWNKSVGQTGLAKADNTKLATVPRKKREQMIAEKKKAYIPKTDIFRDISPRFMVK